METQEPPNAELNPPLTTHRLAKIFLGRSAVVVALLLIGAFLIFTSAFTIQPDEVGVVLRFGAYNRTAEPGLNRKLPTPLERVLKVPIQRRLKQEFGFRTAEEGVRAGGSDRDMERESLMITGDLNVAVVEWIVQYRVNDPFKHLFKVRDFTKTFRGLNEAVMRAAVGDRGIDEVIMFGRLEIEHEAEAHLQELCDRHELGIVIDQVVLSDVEPPDPVKPAFDEIIQAEHERDRAIRDARAAAKGSPKVTRHGIDFESVDADRPEMARSWVLDGEVRGAPPVFDLVRAGVGE